MFKSQQYRAEAAKYGELIKGSTGPDESRKFQERQDRLVSLAIMSRDYRTATTMQCMLQSRIDLAARLLQTKKSTFSVVLARPSSCNGTPYRRRCSGRFSTLPDQSQVIGDSGAPRADRSIPAQA
jgi:hypothetical protein